MNKSVLSLGTLLLALAAMQSPLSAQATGLAEDPHAPAPEKPDRRFIVTSSNPTAKTVRLFILAGQSNMAGLDPQVAFIPAVNDAFPNDDVVVVKDAQSGQPIRLWLENWQPAAGTSDAPEGFENGRGRLYRRLMDRVEVAMENKPKPVSVVLVWMQGEADGYAQYSSRNYDKALNELIGNIRKDLKAREMAVVLGRITDYADPKGAPEDWEAVRQAQVKVAEADPLAKWVDTDDLNGKQNGLHFTGDGYKTLGARFAEKAIELAKSASAN